MGLDFTCPACGSAYTLPDELAGKLARCKQCKSVNRLPKPGPTAGTSRGRSTVPAGSRSAARPSAADRFGIDDAPPPARATATAAGLHDDLAIPPPRRAPARAARVPRRAASGGPWCPPARTASIVGTLVCLTFIVVRQLIYGREVPRDSAAYAVMNVVCLLGLLGTVVSVVGSTCSYLAGNRRAFESESAVMACGWYLSIALWVMMISLVCWVFQAGLLRSRPTQSTRTEFVPILVPTPPPGLPPQIPIGPPVPFQHDPRQDFRGRGFGPRFGPRGPGFGQRGPGG